MNITAFQQIEMSRLLNLAADDIAQVAAQVGIDAKALLATLPAHSVRLTGSQVPVLDKRHRGACSVSYYFNQTVAGEPWPFFRFHTFKDGGITVDFNGFRWLKANKALIVNQPVQANPVCDANGKNSSEYPSTATAKPSLSAVEKSRAEYFALLQKGFQYAPAVSHHHPYIKARLAGYATPQLLSRIMLREFRGKLIAPLERLGGEHTGYQLIMPDKPEDNKRTHVAYPGAMRGSFVRISAVAGLRYFPLMFCEGIFTALSLALVWPGEIRAVLSCNNYKGCRDHLNEKVYFAHDQDMYKPQIGNVGLNHAMAASRAGDVFFTPQFLSIHHNQKPTDFNDMLKLYGLKTLQQAMEQVMLQQSELTG